MSVCHICSARPSLGVSLYMSGLVSVSPSQSLSTSLSILVPFPPLLHPLVSIVLPWCLYLWCLCFVYRHTQAGVEEILTFVFFGSPLPGY